MLPTMETRPVLLVCGLLFIVMPLAVLALLWRRHPRLHLLAWTASGVCMGLMACLIGLRGVAPDWLSVPVANALGFAAYALKVQVLRLEQGIVAFWGRALAVWTLCLGLFLVAWLTPWSAVDRQLITGGVTMAGATLVALLAWRLNRHLDSPGARLIALSFGLLAATIVLRAGRMVLGLTDNLPISPQPDYLLMVTAAMLASLCGNVGYMGMVLDRARLGEQRQRQALEQLQQAQAVHEQADRARAAVRGERYRSSQVLAHEVRQPLHNAAVSLQAVHAALVHLPAAGEARRALGQVQAVIRRVSSSLDNTVAAASLLTSEERVARHEVELAMLVDLCVGDLPAEARGRVQVVHRADARSASMELGLVRLALRNLLINATQYAPPDTPVTLRLLDSDEPLALVIEVDDQGPGLPEDVYAALFDPDHRPPPHSVAPGHGLGLHIVQRVAALHRGGLEWQARQPSGSVFRLLLPQASWD